MPNDSVINGVEVGDSYSASSTTEHYGLPIYRATDKVSFLVDWNGAMQEIDDLLYTIHSTGDVNQQQINALQSAVESAQTTISEITASLSTLTTEVSEVSADNVQLHNRVDTLDTNYTELSSLIASMQTVINNLTTTTIPALTNRVTTLETTVDAVAYSPFIFTKVNSEPSNLVEFDIPYSSIPTGTVIKCVTGIMDYAETQDDDVTPLYNENILTVTLGRHSETRGRLTYRNNTSNTLPNSTCLLNIVNNSANNKYVVTASCTTSMKSATIIVYMSKSGV